MQVAVTRPREQAQAWIDALGQAGHVPHALPLIEIAAVAEPAALQAARQQWQSYQALMFVSSSAVAHFMGHSYSSNSLFPLVECAKSAIKTRAWATGPGTVQALLQAGWPPALIDAPDARQAVQFDSEALWALVRRQVPAGGRVLVVRGADGGRDWLTGQLQAAGVAVDHCSAYRRRLPMWTAAQRAAAFDLAGPLARQAVWLLSSSEGVRNLASLMPGQNWSVASAIATHVRIAQAARDLGFAVVALSRPTLPEVLASIESLA